MVLVYVLVVNCGGGFHELEEIGLQVEVEVVRDWFPETQLTSHGRIHLYIVHPPKCVVAALVRGGPPPRSPWQAYSIETHMQCGLLSLVV